MSVIALTTAGRIELIDPIEQKTLISGSNIAAGDLIIPDLVSGKWIPSVASNAGSAAANLHMALRTAGYGEGLTGLKRGKVDGFNLSALNFGDPVYLSNTTGKLDTVAGSTSVIIGRVQPSTATAIGVTPDKTLHVSIPA